MSDMRRASSYLTSVMLCWLLADAGAAEADGKALYREHCAVCHDAGVGRAPARDVLRGLAPDKVVHALEYGSMAEIGRAALNGSQRASLAEYLTGRIPGSAQIDRDGGRCENRPPPVNEALSEPHWNGWGAGLSNLRFQTTEQVGLTTQDVPRLELAWSFGFPGEIVAQAQPAVVGGRLLVGSRSGDVYALDAKTGCSYWRFKAKTGLRTAISIGPVTIDGRQRLIAVFGDLGANAYAVDFDDGSLLWRSKVDDHPMARVVGAPALYEDKVIVPIASSEEPFASDPSYPCCSFRGSVVALSALDGTQLWRRYTSDPAPRPIGVNSAGTTLTGPAGIGVWSAPTVDPTKGLVYVTTGNAYMTPATKLSDAVIAIDLTDGAIRWSYQATADDAWNLNCYRPDGLDCPGGPDFDFGASPVLVELADGRRVLLAGQKSAVLHALDPDDNGRLLWRTKVGAGGDLGGIEWGIASDGEKVYAPLSDVKILADVDLGAGRGTRPFDPKTGGGLAALDVATGKRIWFADPVHTCRPDQTDCSPGQVAAVTAIPGVVFSGSIDGHLRAYDSSNGEVIWDVDTVREYATVNGVTARGGSLNGPGPVIVDRMLYVNSGYGWPAGMPGNVLLAFSVPDRQGD